MMKKLYYINYSNNWGKGIKDKIQNQINLFKKHGFQCEIITLEKNIHKYKKCFYKFLPFFSSNDYSMLNEIDDQSYIYIRYGKLDFLGFIALKKLHKRSKVIISEIPTYPYDNEIIGIDRLFCYKDYIWRNLYRKCVDYIATYSNDDYIFHVKTLKISNFVDFNQISIKKNIKKINKFEIHMIAVASLAFWHGYDRMIKGMKGYYENNPKYKVIFHFVGDGKELSNYRRLIDLYNLGNYIVLHGKKEGDELNEIYDICDLAIDSLGRHRSNVFYNSTLKGKEYLAKGLPIISGVCTELDFDTNFPFYLRVPADDSNINIDKIVDFYKEIIMPYQEIINIKIRNYAQKNFSGERSFFSVLETMKLYD